MKISVVVPAYNEEKLLPTTLQHIHAASGSFAALGWETDLVVCDNNSKDRTAALAREAGATVVFEPINQIARARNTGASAATGDWLLFIDADSKPSPELFAEVAQAIMSDKYLAGGSTLTFEGNYPVARWAVHSWNWLNRCLKYLAGSFIFCEEAVFHAIGGFNQELFASEEIELTRRLKKLCRHRGKSIVILHRHPMLTSVRKLHLYTPREHFGFLFRTVLRLGGPLKDPRQCFTWYDGRR